MCNRIICANRKKTSNDDAIEINNNTVVLEETDHNDMTEILNKVFPNCGVKISTFLKSQKMALDRHPNGRWWDKGIIRMCLSLWCRSLKGYADLRKSGYLLLPSQNI